ncbi:MULTISPECIES: hypothetical protein [Flammeovirga]|uniref:Uncharacterized protein n=1 Tax=Flammeovirga agarivorans TaxID=2726742 RepID=A0A7X8SKY0_9BACT|nr:MULTISPECIES: hypothetical protein [Flammeovirga]NLR92160.1 hypothetical protein [Flammeovirga agarivorans]
MKHLILKNEIHLGCLSVVPEATKMPISLGDIMAYMNFPNNEIAKNVVERVFNENSGSVENEVMVREYFNQKFNVDEILKSAHYKFNHQPNTKEEADAYLAEVNLAWDDFLVKVNNGLMQVRYSLLDRMYTSSANSLYQ